MPKSISKKQKTQIAQAEQPNGPSEQVLVANNTPTIDPVAPTLGGLPDNLKINILSYLDLKTQSQAAFISKNWYSIFNNEFIWRENLINHFNYSEEKLKNVSKAEWRDEYLAQFKKTTALYQLIAQFNQIPGDNYFQENTSKIISKINSESSHSFTSRLSTLLKIYPLSITKNQLYSSLFHIAIYLKDVEAVDYLLRKYSSFDGDASYLVNQPTAQMDTPLMVALFTFWDPEFEGVVPTEQSTLNRILETLTLHGADPNKRNKPGTNGEKGDNALEFAEAHGAPDSAMDLLYKAMTINSNNNLQL